MKPTENAIRTITCVACSATVTCRMPEGRKYCSLGCYRARRPTRQTGTSVHCAICAVPVYVRAYRFAEGRNFYCSPEHANEAQAAGKLEHTCRICGANFRRPASSSVYGTPTYCSIACRDADPASRERLIRMNAEQATRKINHLERAGYTLLERLGLSFEPQHLIGGKFCVDAFVRQLGLVIQFDGDYWHGNPRRFATLDTRQERRVRLDRSQDAYMRKCGFRVLRIWESDLKTSPTEVAARIQQAAAAV